MLSSIDVKGFRGIGEGTLHGLGRINILVGKNNSGKSSVLEALHLLSTFMDPKDPFGKSILSQLVHRRVRRNNPYFDSLCYNYSSGTPIEFTIGFVEKSEIRADFTVASPRWEIKKPTFKMMDSRYQVQLTSNLAEGRSALSLNTLEGANQTGEYPLYYLRGRLVPEDQEHFNELVGKLDFLHRSVLIDAGLVRELALLEEKIWHLLLRTRLDKELTRMLNEAYESAIENFTYTQEGGNYSLVTLFEKRSGRIDEMGDGFRYAFVMLAIALASKISMLLIEEPENHQHPKALRPIFKALTELVYKNEGQIFISTHSMEFIKLLLETLTESMRKDFRLFHLKLEEGKLSARRLEAPDADVLKDLGVDLRFLDEYK